MKKVFLGSKKKIIIGIIFAIISVVLCNILGGTVKASITFFVLFLAFAPIKFELSEKVLNYIYILLFVGASFVTVFLSQLVLNQGIRFLGILKIGLGMVCCNVVYLLIYFMTLKCRLSVIMGSAMGMILTTVNYFVYKFRGNELMPADFTSLKTAINVAEHYDFTIEPTILYSWILFICVSYISFCLPDLQVKKNYKKYFQVLLIEASLVGILFLGSTQVETWQWRQKGSLLNGYLLNFTLQLRETFVAKPKGYKSDNIEKIGDRYSFQEEYKNDDLPNIIVVMDESFVDFSVLGSEVKTNKDVTPFLDSLNENTVKGYALSSVHGGGTPNSEYEFLTGNTMGFLPMGSIVYQQFIDSQQYSMISNLKNMNYTCVSMHPYLANGWERPTVYPNMGFDKSYFLDDFPQKDLIREYVSDQEMFEQIIKQYENRNTAENIFIFGVSMQNHGGYRTEGFESTISLQNYSREYSDVEEYLSLIHETDSAMKYLLNYFKNREEEVVIVFYGDHFPSLDPQFYEEVHGGSFGTLDEQMLQYKVPFLIWTNYDIEEKFIECTSLNYLSNYVYEASGISLPKYNQFLKDVEKLIPSMNSKGFYSLENKGYLTYDKANKEEREILNQYEQLQYNSLFDEKGRNVEFFALWE